MSLLYDKCACGHRLINHSDIDELHSCNNPRCYCGKFTPTNITHVIDKSTEK